MKKKIFIILVLLVGTLPVFSVDIPGEIVSAFGSGNAAQLARFFNPTIELTLFNKEEIYSKTQAEIILRDFFTQHPPMQFQIIHQGGKDTSKYAIGSLVSGSSKFRVTILLKAQDSRVYIHQLRIEYENVQ